MLTDNGDDIIKLTRVKDFMFRLTKKKFPLNIAVHNAFKKASSKDIQNAVGRSKYEYYTNIY